MPPIQTLNIGSIVKRSTANGPGNRFVIWLQGCHLACSNCFNQEYWSFEKRLTIEADDLLSQILEVPNIEGVTFTGGEPMLQAKGLSLLSQKLKKKDLTVISYTGYTLEELSHLKSPWVSRFLNHIDILIDGRYIHEQASSIKWRGSQNQKVHFLSDAYRHLETEIEQIPADVEFTIQKDGFNTSGIWPDGFLERLKEVMKNG